MQVTQPPINLCVRFCAVPASSNIARNASSHESLCIGWHVIRFWTAGIEYSYRRNGGQLKPAQRSQFRLPPAARPAPPHRSLFAPSVLPPAPSVLPLAPLLLPLKRPCSLSRPGTAIVNPKFGVYILYI
jgi:hypothetical protein